MGEKTEALMQSKNTRKRSITHLASFRSLMKATLLFLCLSLTIHADERVALIIGNDTYLHARPLKAAVNDASAVAESLQKLSFETVDIV